MSLFDSLELGLAGMRIDLTRRQKLDLLSYISLLGKWNKTYNLTAINDPERILTHHILDSLAIAPFVTDGSILDVGSGGGFPGIPLAIVCPDIAVTLLDASQKKCVFMQQVVIELGLGNVNVVHTRVETYEADEKYGQIVSRAFSNLSEFVSLSAHLLATGGRWLAMKGVHPREEMDQLQAARVACNLPLHVPGLNAERCLIILEPV